MQYFKECTYCKITKKTTEFFKDSTKKDKLTCRCKDCIKKTLNRERIKEYSKLYWSDKLEKRRKIVIISHNKNKEHHKKIRKEYLKTTNGKLKHREHSHTRRIKFKNQYVEKVDFNNIYLKFNGFCFYCNKKININESHFDHFIPISKGGKHEEKNIRLSCIKCNLSKGAKMPKEVDYPIF